MIQSQFLDSLKREAKRINGDVTSGMLKTGCSMSALKSPIREIWSTAEDLLEDVSLNPAEQEWLLGALTENVRADLLRYGMDDFGLVYEYL